MLGAFHGNQNRVAVVVTLIRALENSENIQMLDFIDVSTNVATVIYIGRLIVGLEVESEHESIAKTHI